MNVFSPAYNLPVMRREFYVIEIDIRTVEEKENSIGSFLVIFFYQYFLYKKWCKSKLIVIYKNCAYYHLFYFNDIL